MLGVHVPAALRGIPYGVIVNWVMLTASPPFVWTVRVTARGVRPGGTATLICVGVIWAGGTLTDVVSNRTRTGGWSKLVPVMVIEVPAPPFVGANAVMV